MKESGDSVDGCPDENMLQSYTRGALSQRGRTQVERHIDSCSSCRAVIATLAQAATQPVVEPTLDVVTDPNVGVTAGAPMPGHLLADRFLLKQIIGRGAMGIVYEAFDEKLGEPVALKLLAPHITRKADVLEMLRREILLTRKISHPNVCRVFDLGISRDTHFITMQLVRGKTLEQRLIDGPLPPHEAVEVMLQLAAALAAAHAVGVVHRDLKAANVMLDEAGKIWVMDFGLARDLEKDPSYSGPVGTPAYWSPEQATGEPATPASDVYSLGVVGYRLFTGKLPKWHREAPSFADVPRGYRSVLARCMAQRVNERYPDGKAAHAAWVLASRPQVKKRTAAGVALGAGAAAAAGFVLVSAFGQAPAKPPATAPAALAPAPAAAPPEVELHRDPEPPPPEPLPALQPATEPDLAAAPIDAGAGGSPPTRSIRPKPKPKNDIPIFE